MTRNTIQTERSSTAAGGTFSCGTGQKEFPLITIGVSAYNRRDYLILCLESLLAQTYPNCQIIVVDDGSTDGTAEMMHKRFPQIRYVYQKNAGDAAAKNHAARLAEGEYVVFNDSDDLFLPDAVERLYNALPSDDRHAISYGNYLSIDADGNTMPTKRKADVYPSGNITGDLLRHIFVNSCATLIPRDVYWEFGGYDTSLKVCHDYDMYLKMSLKHRFYAVQEPVFLRRRHGSNLSGATYEKVQISFKVFSDFVEAHPELRQEYGTIILRRTADYHNKLYREACREGLRKNALEHIKCAMQAHFSFKSFVRWMALRITMAVKPAESAGAEHRR